MSDTPPSLHHPAAEAATPLGGPPFLSKLRVRLLLLVLLAIMPALGLVLYTAIEQRRASMKEAIAAAQRVVAFAASEQKQHLESSRQLLMTLAQLKEVHPSRPEDAQELFRNLLQIHPLYANLGAIGPDGRVFASAVPGTNELYLGDRSYFMMARDSGKFAVGEYQVGRITGKATLNLAYPIRPQARGEFLGVIFLALDLTWLNQLAARAELPEGSTLTVVDRKGIILVRHAIAGTDRDWTGESITNHLGLATFLKAGVEAGGIETGLDGVKRLYSSTPLNRTGGLADARVIVGIPLQVAHASANHTLVQHLIFLSIASVLALGAAWTGGDIFILRQVRGLVSAARRMRGGDLSARSGVDHGPGEIGQLAMSFDEMAATLEQRVGELQRADAELQTLNEDLEQRVLERTLELRRSNEDLEQFAYVASHDLQEPLRMINKYLQLLSQRYRDRLDPNALEFIAFALDGAKRMHQLIHDLLAYSRVGTNSKELVPTDCGQVLAETLANLQLAIEESGAQITHDPLPTVQGDVVQLTQLFQNLIGNALKFRGAAAPRIHVGVERSGANWNFSVQDNGIGIAAEDYQRIFIVFQRLHSREKYPGTGIGLSVCKKIIERHGGRIWVESKLGKGTTFRFTLPCSAAPPAAIS